MIKNLLPKEAFYDRGIHLGPMVIMTDDCMAERKAVHSAWPSTKMLLVCFTFCKLNGLGCMMDKIMFPMMIVLF